MRKNKQLLNSNTNNILLNERRHIQKGIYNMIPFKGSSKTSKLIWVDRIPVIFVLIRRRHQDIFWVTSNALYFDQGSGEFTYKKPLSCVLKIWAFCCMYASLQLKKVSKKFSTNIYDSEYIVANIPSSSKNL